MFKSKGIEDQRATKRFIELIQALTVAELMLIKRQKQSSESGKYLAIFIILIIPNRI